MDDLQQMDGRVNELMEKIISCLEELHPSLDIREE